MIKINDILTHFPEVLNILPHFKIDYQNIIDILYYGVKEMGFTAHDLLEELPYFDVLFLIDKWQEDVKEKNKQQEKENERYENMMADAKHGQRMYQNNFKQDMSKLPSMPSLPKF